jgi:hypothetical protein
VSMFGYSSIYEIYYICETMPIERLLSVRRGGLGAQPPTSSDEVLKADHERSE